MAHPSQDRRPRSQSLSLWPSSMPLSPSLAHLVAAFQPRKPRQRTTLLALLGLVGLTTYILIAHSSSFHSSIALRQHESTASEQLAAALDTIQHSRMSEIKTKHRQKSQQSLQLSPEEELGALTSFLASLPQNVVPLSVDPTVPIDPQLILDFDTRNARAKEEVQTVVEDVWHRNPVFLYSKYFSPQSREVKNILSRLYLKPSPTIIDVDTRDDAEVLLPMLKRLTSATDLPLLIVGGKPFLKSVEELKELEKNGQLQDLVKAAGSIVNGAKKKKQRK